MSIFIRQFHKRIDFSGKFTKNFDFSGNLTKYCDFSKQISEKFRFFRQFYWLFTAISGQIILGLFLFKSHHFRTHFLYMIKYNNIFRPIHNPHAPPAPPTTPLPKIGGGIATPKPPRIDAYVNRYYPYVYRYFLRAINI